jgi:benzoate-CoA ligase
VKDQDLSSLRLATSAGEALPEELHNRWKNEFGVELLDGLGTAEMWHVFITNRPGAVKPGTIGQAVEGFDVRVCDDEGNDVPANEVGVLRVRGNSLAIGYWRNMEKTKAHFHGEWNVTGDMVRRDEDGWFTYCGRSDELLKVSGKWLSPGEVENCLLQHPAVKECAVVGKADENGLIKPRAYVVVTEKREGLEGELQQFVKENLEPYKYPREVLLLDDLPRTHLGKVNRADLRKRP